MPKFRFTITSDATISALVTVTAATIEEAQEIALTRSFYTDPSNAAFHLDDGNTIKNVYLPDDHDFEVIESPKKLIGFQICNAEGNISGDQNDPTSSASFEVFAPELATDLAMKIGRGYLLQPIFDDDIEEPTIITMLPDQF